MDGAVALSTSVDLIQWEDQDPLFVPTMRVGELEVPQMFKIGDRWYLLASAYDQLEGVGKPSYWSSEFPTGPWESHFTDALDGGDLRAAQVYFDGVRYRLMGWIPYRPGNVWGGSLNLPREVYQLEDGSLGTRFDAAVSSAIRGPLLFPVEGNDIIDIVAGEWDVTEDSFSYAGDETATAGVSGAYRRFDISATVELNGPESGAGIRISDGSSERLYEVWLTAAGDELQIRRTPDDILTSIPMQLEIGSKYALRVIVERGVIEVNCNDTHTLVARLASRINDARITLVAGNGPVTFDNLTVHWLNGLADAR
jgi:sucrose-6-phosphate hydrolase SacC (GH32 family)